MAAQKLVVQSDLPTLEFLLTAGSQRIGSGRQCEICISHPEVPAHAVTVESRGNVLLVNNVSPYSLYLGDEIVESRGRCAWRLGVPLLLTRNVTMTVVPTVADSETADVERNAIGSVTPPSTSSGKVKSPAAATSARPSSGMRTAVQIVIIVLSLVSGLFMLRDAPKTEAVSTDTIESLSKALASKKSVTSDERELLNQLQAAWITQQRAIPDDRKEVIAAYQRVLDHRLVRSAAADRTTVPGRVKMFATQQLGRLSTKPR